MKHFHMKRLRKLADFLDKLPDAKFNFASVVYQGEKPMLKALEAGKHRCGTTACAMGWMPAVFPRDIIWLGRGDTVVSGKKEDEPDAMQIALRKSPHRQDFIAAEHYFGLSDWESSFLFSPDMDNGLSGHATAKQVAKHIRKFVAKKQKEKAAR